MYKWCLYGSSEDVYKPFSFSYQVAVVAAAATTTVFFSMFILCVLMYILLALLN